MESRRHSSHSCVFWMVLGCVTLVGHFAQHATVSANTRPLRQSYACEGQNLNINCNKPGEVNQRIRIVRANYGRYSIAVCNPNGMASWSTKCMSHTSLQVLTERCSDQTSCSVEVADRTFGDDPCPDTDKYLEVHYECVAAETETTPTTPMFVVPTQPAPTFQSRVFAVFTTRATTTPTTSSTATTTSTSTTLSSTATTTLAPVVYKTTEPAEFITAQVTGRSSSKLKPVPPKELPTSLPSQFAQNAAAQAAEFCTPTWRQGIFWPKTPKGATAFEPCPNSDPKGPYAVWSCDNSSPPQWSQFPDFNQCLSPWMDGIRRKAATDMQPEQIAEEFARLTATNLLTSGGDMSSAVDLIGRIVNRGTRAMARMSLDEQDPGVQKLGESVLKAGSNLLDVKHNSSWQDMAVELRSQTATSLIDSLESTAFMLAENVPVGTILTSSDQNIVMGAGKLQTRQLAQSYKFPPPNEQQLRDEDMKTSIELSSSTLQQYSRDDVVKVVFLSYSNIGDYLQAVGSNPGSAADAPPEEFSVNSKIISAAINGMHQKTQLNEPVIITLKHTIPQQSGAKAVCAFWDYGSGKDKDFKGAWSSRGCWVVTTDDEKTVCACSHLTNFAVLMDVSGSIGTSSHNDPLTKITFIGCSISIFCLVMTLVIFCSFRSLQSERTTIHKNLAFCLLVAEVFFLAGISQTQLPIGCNIFSAIMHYFFLATFAWSLFEGVNLWLLLVEVFESEKSRRVWYYLLGYGAPAIIVGVCLGVDWKSYATANYCWLRADNYFILSFVIPVGLVVLANIFFLSVAMYYMCRNVGLQSALHARDPNTWKHLKTWISGAFGLVFVMSITWVFGFMYLGSLDTIIFAYIFTFLNSFQGVFIFVLVCLRNEKVKAALRQFYGNQTERFSNSLCTRSPSAFSDSDPTGGRKGFYECSPPLDKDQYISSFAPYWHGPRPDMSRRNTVTSTLPPHSPPVPQCTCEHDFPEKGSTRSSNRDSGHESVSCPSAESPPMQPVHIHQRTLYPPSVARKHATQVMQAEYPATAARLAARNAKYPMYGDRGLYCASADEHIYAEIEQQQMEEQCPYSESDESNTSTYQRALSDTSTDEDHRLPGAIIPVDADGRKLPMYHASNCSSGSEHKPLINSLGRLSVDPLRTGDVRSAFRSLSNTNPHAKLRQAAIRQHHHAAFNGPLTENVPYMNTRQNVHLPVQEPNCQMGTCNAFGLTGLRDGSKMVRRLPLMPKASDQSLPLSYSEC